MLSAAGHWPFMPKSHATNKVHFACFECRSSFKQPNSSNWDADVELRPFECPNCKIPMTRMGKYFKAPPKRDVKQWFKIELLFAYGERFVSSHTNISWRCDTLPATITYLVESGHDESEVRARLDLIRGLRRS